MNKKHKLLLSFCSIFFLGLFFPDFIISQVTIGSGESPRKGALLDLKTSDTAVSNKGLLLPRVELVSLTTLEPMYDYEKEPPSPEDLTSHTGLLVFNVTKEQKNPCDFTVSTLNEGLYVWNGAAWTSLTGDDEPNEGEDILQITIRNPEVKIFMDKRNGTVTPYTYREFGNAGTWMTMNLRATSYSENNPFIPAASRNLVKGGETLTPTRGKYYMAPYPYYKEGTTDRYAGFDETWLNENPLAGYVYSYTAIIGGLGSQDTRPNTQGLCPDGWHVPKLAEYQALKAEIFARPYLYLRKDANGGYDYDNTYANAFVVPCTPYATTGNQFNASSVLGNSLSYSDGGFGDFGLGFLPVSPTALNFGKGDHFYWYNSGRLNELDQNIDARPRYISISHSSPNPSNWSEREDTNSNWTDLTFATGLRCKKD